MSSSDRFLVGTLAVVAGCILWTGWSVAEEKSKEFPKGSEKAVKSVKEALPKATVDAVEQPKGFGGDPKGESPLFWTVRYHQGDDKQELSVTPEGTIIRFSEAVDTKEVPEKVKDGLAKAAPDAKVLKIEKQEMRASLRYAALAKPEVEYTAEVVKGDKKVHIRAAADGTILNKTEVKEEKKPAKEKDEAKAAPKTDDKKKPNIPEAAAKAVKAVQDAFPDADVTGVENVGFMDGTGTIEILNYEVEYKLKGVEHELNVTPEGVIIQVIVPAEVKDLPKAVADALAKEVPDGKVQNASRTEVRAGLKFVALDKAKVIYVASVEDKKGKLVVKLRTDGSEIKEVNPLEKKKDAGEKKEARP